MARAIDASRFGEIMEQWKKDCLECDDQHGADVIADVILPDWIKTDEEGQS